MSEVLIPGYEPEIAPGVRGYTMEHAGAIYVPLVIAERQGSGDVGRFLDTLDPSRTYKFPCVLSPVLRGMLERRGFTVVHEHDDLSGEDVEVYIRAAQVETT